MGLDENAQPHGPITCDGGGLQLSFSISYTCTETVLQEPDGDPLFITAINHTNHVSSVTPQSVHFCTDDYVVFLCTGQQPL